MRSASWVPVLLAVLVAIPLPGSVLAADEGPTMAHPRPGDTGVYRITSQTDAGQAPQDPSRLAFELGEPTQREDAYGRERTVWPLIFNRTQSLERDRIPRTAWLADGTSAPIGHYVQWSREENQAGQGLLDSGDERLQLWSKQREYSHRGDLLSGPSCVLVGPWVAGTLTVDQRIEPVFCGRDLSSLPNGTAELTVEARRTIGEDDVFQLNLSAVTEQLEVSITWWVNERIPYPMQISADVKLSGSFTGSDWTPTVEEIFDSLFIPLDEIANPTPQEALAAGGQPRFHVDLILERFRRGQGDPLPAEQDRSWPRAHPDLASGPVDAWGPADGGSTFPFPLSQAVEALRTDPSLDAFHDWAASHPERRVTAANYLVTENKMGNEVAHWFFEIGAPDGSYWQLSSRKDLGPDAAEPVRRDLPVIRNSAEPADQGISVPDPPLSEAPTIAYALDRWRATFPDEAAEHGPNRFTWIRTGNHSWIFAGWEDPRQDTTLNPFDVHVPLNQSTVSIELDGALDRKAVGGGELSARYVHAGRAERTDWQPPPTPTAGTADTISLAGIPPGAAAAGVLAVLLGLATKFLLVPLYGRLSDDEILDNDTRRAIFDVLARMPASTPAELARAVDPGRSTVRYHLRKLEERDLACKIDTGEGSRWFQAGQADPGEMHRQAILATGRAGEVYDAIRGQPGMSLTQLAATVGLKRPSAHRVVERLLQAGLIDKTREGRSVSLEPISDTSSP